jgi:hypothetical protein
MPISYIELNNYPYNDTNLMDNVYEYLRTNKTPDFKYPYLEKQFKKRWDQFELNPNGQLKLKNNNLIVLFTDEEKENALKNVYNDITQGTSQGTTLFYKRIRNNYLNLKRDDVDKFIKSQKIHQLVQKNI